MFLIVYTKRREDQADVLIVNSWRESSAIK